MITTPVSPAHILKGSPSPTSSTSGTGGKKTSRPPKGSKQFSSPISNHSSSSPSIPPITTPNDQLPQQHLPPFKGPVIPPPTHFPYFPMNPMAMPNVPMMYAPLTPMHMIPTTTPMFSMFPQPVMTNIPPTTPHNSSKIPTPIQPKPSTSPPSTQSSTITQTSKTKPKKKKRPPTTSKNVNIASDNNSNNTSPVVSSNITKTAESTSNQQQKRKEPPTTSRSVHQHIISYLWELGLKDSAKILENDLNNPLLLNASEDRVSSFVHNLSNEVERQSHTIPPSNKRISTNEKSSSSNFTTTDETSIINSRENDSLMSESNSTTDKYNSENYLNILKETIKPESCNKLTAEHVNERLENLEQTLGIKEQKVEVFERMKEVEERMLKLDVNKNNETAQQQSVLDNSGTASHDYYHDDNFFDSFFEDETDNYMSEAHLPLDIQTNFK